MSLISSPAPAAVAKVLALPGASEFSQRTVRFCLGGLGKQEVQLAIVGILLDFRVPAFPIQLVKPAAQLGVVGFRQFQDGLLNFGYGFRPSYFCVGFGDGFGGSAGICAEGSMTVLSTGKSLWPGSVTLMPGGVGRVGLVLWSFGLFFILNPLKVRCSRACARL